MMNIEAASLLRSARLMRQALLAILAALVAVAFAVLAWVVVDLNQIGTTLAEIAGYDSLTPRRWQSFALSMIVLIHLAIWAGVAWTGQKIFAALLVEDVPAASDAAAALARLLWVMLAWGIIGNTLVPLLATWHFPEGQRTLVIGLGSAQVSTILAALLATFTSHAFVLGAALWQDHKAMI